MIPSKETLIATNRFGLGASQNDITHARSNPRQWLHDQINTEYAIPNIFMAQPSSEILLNEAYENRRLKNIDAKKAAGKIRRRGFNQSLRARLTNQVQTERPFAERLVMFWSNHFTVSRTRGLIGPAIPSYENEAIRPFIFSRFEDMLVSVTQHPCMLIYLDNTSSIGPNSRQGARRGKDLNENLAREVLELHTMGSQGGYTQTDITNFAKILTGWTVSRKRKNPKQQKVPPGKFQFNNRTHEPGPQILLGKTFNQNGKRQGVQALREIARHPSTANFIATKLVRYFINDNPAKADIKTIARVFRKTNGDLAEVSTALIDLKSAWKTSGTKIKTPEELIISAMRALQIEAPLSLPRRQLLFPALKSMGQEVFHAPSPAGWPDEAKAWIAPESLMHRIEWVREFSRQSAAAINPLEIFDNTIGPFASDEAKRMIKGAPSREDGLALIFSSPAFQRR
ncbi:DUF1800 family protein [Fretibacter rubidus]|uniref:DUF1800 domain-containing protein n=1 Tax=Fretibacter rubidus TaxID=570162 RepID=UPI00352B2C9C